jgi:hypothetical protein
MVQKNIYAAVVSLFIWGFPFSVFAQSIKDMRINEIQVHNTNGLRDDYGQLVGWIELFNTGYNKVDIAGCILKVNGKEYRIPKGDPNTVVSTRGYCLFYAGGDPNRGTFYTNFTLDNTDFIELYDVDGRLIDSFGFNPAEMKENISYGWFGDKDGVEKRMSLPATTPGSSNETEEKIARAELFRQADPVGIVLTITSIFVVACSLIVLFFIFKILGELQMKRAHKKAESAKAEKKVKTPVNVSQTGVITNDELVAIAIALYKYSQELHDIEATVLTINRAAKVYSPWSSKIYSLTQLPNKK